MKVLIVDDEAPARDRLRQMLEESGEHSVVGDASTGQEALEIGARLAPDVVLLDIRMPGMSGIETAHHFNAFEDPPAIVFTTAYDQYAIDAFDAQAVGYVLKPVRRERLAKALVHAARINAAALGSVAATTGIDDRRSQLCIRVHGAIKLIPVAEVVYFQSDQKYTRVCYDGGQHLIDDSLKQLEQEFGEQFVRIHRNTLVAIAHIDALHKAEDGEVSVRLRDKSTGEATSGMATDADSLKVSRRHVAAVRRRLRGNRP